MLEVNYLAVLVSAVIGFIIGGFWYSQSGFGKQWMRLMKISKKDVEKVKKKGMAKSMIIAFLSTIVMAYVLAIFIKYVGTSTIIGGVLVGFWIWLGFLATAGLSSILWEGRPFKLYLINVTHYLVVLVVMGAILAVW